MNHSELSVREMQFSDIELIVQYWLSSDQHFLAGMGADIQKLPTKEEWMNMLWLQLRQSYNEKQSYCIIWLVNDVPVGHNNVNKITLGKEAYMHLHLWNSMFRKRGLGVSFVKRSLPYFFNNLQLKKLYCEPYVLNPAPNKTLEKVGFTFLKKYYTTPGFINFEQEVNL